MRFKTATASPQRKYILPSDVKNPEFKNCYIENGGVRTRPAVLSQAEKQIFRRGSDSIEEMSFICTDCYVYLNGNYGRVAVSVTDNLMGNITYNMRLICIGGEVMDLGMIEFSRATYGVFGYPDSFTVFRGEPITGCGIYFIVRQVYGAGIPDGLRVMELKDEMNGWSMLTDSKIYFPTVLSCGRGENYHNAILNEKPLELPKSVKPESKNLLSAGFYAQYTADSASNSFMLPYDNIDDRLVQCELSYGGKTYIWGISAGMENSEAVDVEGNSVQMCCNRKLGRVYFVTAAGAAWAPPYTGSINNLTFLAYKTVEGHNVKVSSMSSCCRLDGDAMTQGSNVTAFYGSRLYPSQIIVNSPRHPLYFPEDGQVMLGETVKEITKLVIRDRYLLAFKENEVYSCEIKQYEDSLSEEGGVYPLTFKKAAGFYTAPLPRSIVCFQGDIIFASENGGIYRLNGTTAGTYKTERIADTEKELLSDSVALVWNDVYLLVGGHRALTVQKTEKGFVSGEWSLPERVVNGFSHLGDAVLFSEFFENEEYLIYSSVLGGEKDRVVVVDGNELGVEEYSVKAQYGLPLFDASPNLNRIYRIRVDGYSEDMELAVSSREQSLLKRRGRVKKEGICFLCGCVSASPRARFTFSGNTLINGFAVEYKRLNKL